MIGHKHKTRAPDLHIDAPSWHAPAATVPSGIVHDAPLHLRVLIVDDSEMDRAWLAAQAKMMDGFKPQIMLARSLGEARAAIAAHRFHLALVDYRLGPVYGDEVIGLLNDADPDCATILVSSHTMAEVSLFGLKAGATAALSKDDINPSLLETTIRFALANRAKTR